MRATLLQGQLEWWLSLSLMRAFLLIFIVFVIAIMLCPMSISTVKLFNLVAVYLVPSAVPGLDQWVVIERMSQWTLHARMSLALILRNLAFLLSLSPALCCLVSSVATFSKRSLLSESLFQFGCLH